MSAVLPTAASSCEPCAAHVAKLRTLAANGGGGPMLRELSDLAAGMVARQAARAGSSIGAEWQVILEWKLEQVGRWLDDEAAAFVHEQQGDVAALLQEAFDRLATAPRGERRLRATRVLRVVLHERLVSWRIALLAQVQEMFQSAARTTAGLSDARLPEATSRVFYRMALPATFLDPAAAWDALVERLGPSKPAWRRATRQLHAEARTLLRANAAAVAADLKQQLHDGAALLVARRSS